MDLITLSLIVVIIVVVFMLILNGQKLSNLRRDIDDKEDEIKRVLKENQELSVYRGILDADKEAKERLDKAQKEAASIVNCAKDEADGMIAKAHIEKAGIDVEIEQAKSTKRQLIKRTQEQVDSMKNDATRQASSIISEAEKKAKEIAGEAYEIANKAKEYEEIATAMKNVIQGYGDEYLKPTFSLLDELAEEYGFDNAGQQLKDARERTKLMMSNDQAASCDYLEPYRKKTAKNFVLDAFNGKVDTILASIKKDNYGTLERKIKDAFSLVNHLGTAFRRARINQSYLDARLNELKWAVAVNELKLKEREEQRRIREQIREEEKARREYERAIKEAEKEEETIRKAMEKARQAIEKANEEQKAKYEAQLSELQAKLVEAEAKNQRALSMAQQTKSGHVYVISNIGSFGENVFKIGMTRRLEPLDRVKELGDASVPFPFDVHAMIYSDNAPQLETELHQFFVRNQVNKVNPRKEFFRIPISEIRQEIEKRGIDAKWTIMADALEYKETLAIEKAMNSNKQLNDDWIEKQKAFREDFDDIEENNGEKE